MAEELSFRAEAAAEYDRAFGRVSAHFLPFLLSAARLAPGQRVLDVATGTGISAEGALDVVGPGGFVLATDISPEMVDKARARLTRSQHGPRGRGRAGDDLARRQLRCRDLCARVDVFSRSGARAGRILPRPASGRTGGRLGQGRV